MLITKLAPPVPVKHKRYPGSIGDPLDMFVERYYRDNVGYIVTEDFDKRGGLVRWPIGTAFFARVQQRDIGIVYLVTCLHVVRGTSTPLFLRINNESGSEDIPLSSSAWNTSQSSDVAISMFNPPFGVRVWACPIDSSTLMMEDSGEDYPWTGLEVFMTGLFTGFPGQEKVEALVRTGRIARPRATVELTIDSVTKEKRMVNVHLIQAMSWAGESGSPVFAYHTHETVPQDINSMAYGQSTARVQSTVIPRFFGVLHGHFPIEYEAEAANKKRRIPENQIGGKEVNSGIAIVVPAKDVYELLMSDPVAKQRQEFVDSYPRDEMGRPRPNT